MYYSDRGRIEQVPNNHLRLLLLPILPRHVVLLLRFLDFVGEISLRRAALSVFVPRLLVTFVVSSHTFYIRERVRQIL